jgi:peptidoglycan/LPS O-acetylase OafA/YrhL/lysophospholipase L1-like esterase
LIDAAKGVALLWIVLNHVVERVFGFEYIWNPVPDWPPISARIAQWTHVVGHGALADGLLTAVRDVGWLGDQGVGMFIVLSGMGLTFGALSAAATAIDPLMFYRKRLLRIVPLWWAAHAFFALTFLVFGWGLDPFTPAAICSFFGLRFLPQTMYYFSPSWWYIGLLIQLYVIFPFAFGFARRYGPLTLLVLCTAAGCAARAIGFVLLHGYQGDWERGAVFLTRLPEFAFGMTLAFGWFAQPERMEVRFTSPAVVAAALGLFAAGNVAALTRAGMVVAPLTVGVADTLLAFAALQLLARVWEPAVRGLSFVGRHSYSLYLVHQPFVDAFVPLDGLARGLAARVAAALGLSAVVAWILELSSSSAVAGLRRKPRLAIAAAIASLALTYVLALAADQVIASVDPQETNGWGERASLEPSAVFGWTLRPSRTTHLRWSSYDYRVTSNALGFPGPQYSDIAPPGTLRILVTGDAFTSAEGVDTGEAWPRVLEELLTSELHRPVQVLNFAITGYGPNQYRAVVGVFARRFRPDVILIGMFVNDYGDALRTDDDFRREIGFTLPPQHTVREALALHQLRAFLAINVRQRLAGAIGKPYATGYQLGNFEYLERTPVKPYWAAGASRVQDDLIAIRSKARQSDSVLAVVLFPAGPQACAPADLAYYPAGVDLQDERRFDPDRPQRTTASITRRLNVPFLDLRPALAARGCDFQPNNMHLTEKGHRDAAHAIARWAALEQVLRSKAACRERQNQCTMLVRPVEGR